jgi:hypothetical protein
LAGRVRAAAHARCRRPRDPCAVPRNAGHAGRPRRARRRRRRGRRRPPDELERLLRVEARRMRERAPS